MSAAWSAPDHEGSFEIKFDKSEFFGVCLSSSKSCMGQDESDRRNSRKNLWALTPINKGVADSFEHSA